jgi:hypothetical protein
MTTIDRAAQFSPFAALTVYAVAVKGTARLTADRVELDEYMKDALSHKLQGIEDRLEEHPKIEITYFQPDVKKNGGAYVTAISATKKIDKYEWLVFMTDGTLIPIDEIHKLFYYRELKEYKTETRYLEDTCLSAQDKYTEVIKYFGGNE